MGVRGIDDDGRLGIVVRTPSSRPICFTSTALHSKPRVVYCSELPTDRFTSF